MLPQHQKEHQNIGKAKTKKNYFVVPKLPLDKALHLLVNAGLSKTQYELIKSVTKENGCNIFPSYKKVTEGKEKCYPKNP